MQKISSRNETNIFQLQPIAKQMNISLAPTYSLMLQKRNFRRWRYSPIAIK